MEIQQDGCLPFLDVLVQHTQTARWGKKITERKPTQTGTHAKFQHHPAQNRSLLKRLLCQAEKICVHDSKTQEIEQVKDALWRNGYNEKFIKKTVRPMEHRPTRTEKIKLLMPAYLLYVSEWQIKESYRKKEHHSSHLLEYKRYFHRVKTAYLHYRYKAFIKSIVAVWA